MEKITWQKGQSFTEKRQYYFCKYARFTLTLLTVCDLNLTRVEIYLENLRLYVFEEELGKEEATSKLQNFLSTLAEQLQTLSQIEFLGEKL